MASLSTALIASTSRLRALVRRAAAVGDGRGLPLRREPRAEQRLADIDIAEPGHDALVEQRGLQRSSCRRRRPPASRRRTHCRAARGRARATAARRSSSGARHELHRAEAARIVEAIAARRSTCETPRGRAPMLGALVVIGAGRATPAVALDAERARHAEMHHQHVAGGQIGQQIFGAAAEPVDRLALRAARRNPSATASAGRRGAPRP